MNLIITHAHCPDGWCAAFIAKKRYPEAEIMPLDHGSPVPFDAVRDKDVLVVDFSWPNREDNIELHRIAKSFHIFDHHKTAQERLEELDFATFDMSRSGAGLAWDCLFGKDAPLMWYGEEIGKPFVYQTRPWYVDYVEDRDLWNWALPDSKAVNAYLMSLPQTIEAWSALDILKVEYAEQIGVGILRHVDRYVQEAVAEAQLGDWYTSGAPEFSSCFECYTVAVVNVPYMNCSEVGHELAKKARVGMTWFERADGQIQFSLRSIGDIDVSRIAKLYGGGGHKNAAGFRMSLQEGRNLIDTILRRTMTQEQMNKCLDAMAGIEYPGPRC
jgi:oligoribonuclease NrnB/cAMP/cGMP phosphodiesterase (DHH superfamily)